MNLVRLGRHINDKKSIGLFHNVVFTIDEAIPQVQKKRLINLLINNGGQDSMDTEEGMTNLFISSDKQHDSNKEIISVTPLWVEKAVSNGFVHDTKYYLPGKNQFLSGQVFLLLDLPSDHKAILDEIEKSGGQFRDDLTQDITCLICANPKGSHYNECRNRNIPIVLPQWLDDCFRYQKKLEYGPYRFPSPSVYHQFNSNIATIHNYPKDIPTLTALVSADIAKTKPFRNKVIWFGSDLIHDQRKLVMIPIMTEYIEKAGGQVVTVYDPHAVDIVVLKYRSSQEYKRALKDKKYVASFWWVSNTLARGYFCSPTSVLLDYPVPKTGIPLMEECVIAVTGFKGTSRLFVNTLIAASGARYSPELEKDTTHLICGGESLLNQSNRGRGNKYSDLSRFPKVNLVNHIWLEECYAQWKKLDWKENTRYCYIPKDNALLANTVGRTHLIQSVVDLWKNDTLEAEPEFIVQKYEDGFVHEKKPRQAALRAQRVLNDIVMPDVNAYEQEIRSMNRS